MSASLTSGTLHAPLKDLLPFALKITQEACTHYTAIQDAADEIDDQDAVGEAVDEMMDTAYINCMLYQGASNEVEQRKGEEQLLNMRSNLKLSMVGLIICSMKLKQCTMADMIVRILVKGSHQILSASKRDKGRTAAG